MNTSLRTIALAVGMVSLVSGCGPTIKDNTKRKLDAPVNCKTASRDIQTLEQEKASVGERMVAGVRFVAPVAAVSGLLQGDYGNRVNVAVGQYNDDIDQKIKQIKTTCGQRRM